MSTSNEDLNNKKDGPKTDSFFRRFLGLDPKKETAKPEAVTPPQPKEEPKPEPQQPKEEPKYVVKTRRHVPRPIQ